MDADDHPGEVSTTDGRRKILRSIMQLDGGIVNYAPADLKAGTLLVAGHFKAVNATLKRLLRSTRRLMQTSVGCLDLSFLAATAPQAFDGDVLALLRLPWA
ncbi:MAG: hypothetical protein GDA41_06410 [Rhodospirillales bacterium]|nr:hypothetical protein [Rhodospirillales bacterium]